MKKNEEQSALKCSIAVTAAIGLLGIVTGLIAGSQALVFDGMYSVVDVMLTFASLAVSKLLTQEGSERFQFGYWHLEPLLIALGSSILVIACLYAAVNAVQDLLGGGRVVSYGIGAAWAGVLCITCFVMTVYMGRIARRLKSGLLILDSRSWLVGAFLSLALLLSFVLAIALAGTAWEGWTPYVDAVALLCMALAILPVPVKTLLRALREVLLVAPDDLDQRVRALMDELVQERGFIDYSSYVAKIGRTRMVEIHVLVGPGVSIDTATADALRREISGRLNAIWPQFWLTIDFTADRAWL
ncbi:MAG TPA: cation transporter [Burkholderiales bacterium]|nr:cation transporter [Burkholderiales bacterium]